MATLDLHHDIEPLNEYQKPVYPTLAQLRQALTDGGFASKYDLDHGVRNDLIYACRVEGIDIFPVPEEPEE